MRRERLVRHARRVAGGVLRRTGLRPRKRAVDGTAFAPGAPPSRSTQLFVAHVARTPGWFNIDDCAHFSLVLGLQNAASFDGDIFEVGSYHGRSTVVLAQHLLPGQSLVVCDAFEAPTEDSYVDRPTPEGLLANIKAAAPWVDVEQVDLHACLSTDLEIASVRRFRFAHIDGGHSREVALHDLHFVAARCVPGAIIAVDDYEHPAWPGVTAAVDEFVRRPGVDVVADLNRHGAKGRKIYLRVNPDAVADRIG